MAIAAVVIIALAALAVLALENRQLRLERRALFERYLMMPIEPAEQDKRREEAKESGGRDPRRRSRWGRIAALKLLDRQGKLEA